MDLPWMMKPLHEWSIVGMNHYHSNGTKHIFVAMTKGDRCIQEEGLDDEFLWNRLEAKAVLDNLKGRLIDDLRKQNKMGRLPTEY